LSDSPVKSSEQWGSDTDTEHPVKVNEEQEPIRCALCDSRAEAHFWDATAFTVTQEISLCGKCADSKLPAVTEDDRPRQKTTTGEIGIDLMRIGIIEGASHAVILLREIGGSRRFAIMIRDVEANLLIDALLGRRRARPTVHEAWVDAFTALKSRIVRACISDLREHVFYAKLHISAWNCETDIDLKPSDALVLAVLSKARVFAPEEVLDRAAKITDTRETLDPTVDSSAEVIQGNPTLIDFAGQDREAVSVVMRYLSMLKPEGMRQVQKVSMTLLYERQRQIAEQPERVVLDPELGMIYSKEEAETRIIFAQIQADDMIRKKFNAYRDLLPPESRIHQLPLERVGALATLDLSAFAACADAAEDDFIALSVGIIRLSHWGLLIARTMGVAGVSGTPDSEIEKNPLSWWKSSLAALAMDLLGWPFDSHRSALVSAWAGLACVNDVMRSNLQIALEGFVCFHEIGHFELHHGDAYRHSKLTGKLRPEGHYTMEYEADKFALDQLLRVLDRRSATGTALATLFGLYACEPTILQRYPLCDEPETHPHPLTRLAWLLRQLFPEDSGEQAKYMRFATSVVTDVIRELGGVPFSQSETHDENLEPIIRMFALSKPDVNELRFGPHTNEVIDTQFRLIDAMKKAARRSKTRS
jgi:bifunctional DNase/RNase